MRLIASEGGSVRALELAFASAAVGTLFVLVLVLVAVFPCPGPPTSRVLGIEPKREKPPLVSHPPH